MARIGRMDRRVSLQSYATPTGGDPTAGTFTTQATVWAERMDPAGMERAVGGQYAAEASQAFRIRYDSEITPTPKWRVVDGSENWDVVAVLPDGRNRDRILMVRRLDPDNL